MIKNNLKKARLDRDIKAVDLAKALNVSKQTVSNWERGVRFPDINTLIKLADLYNVSIDYLVGREEEKTDIDLIGLLSSIPTEKRKLLMSLLMS